MFSRGRTVHWNTTDSVDELRRLVYNVLFDVRGRAEGYDNVREILRDLRARPFFLDGHAEARRHGYDSFDQFITSGIMEHPSYADGHAGGLLKIYYRDGRPIFFEAVPHCRNRQHFHDMDRSRAVASDGAAPQSHVGFRSSSVNRYPQSSAVAQERASRRDAYHESGHQRSQSIDVPPRARFEAVARSEPQQQDDDDDETGFENYVPSDRSNRDNAVKPDDGQLQQEEANEEEWSHENGHVSVPPTSGASDEWHAMPDPRRFTNIGGIDMETPPVPEIPLSTADANGSAQWKWEWLSHWLIVVAWRVRPNALSLSELVEQIREEYPSMDVILRGGRFSNAANSSNQLKTFIDAHLPMLGVFNSPSEPRHYHVVWRSKYVKENPGWAKKYNRA